MGRIVIYIPKIRDCTKNFTTSDRRPGIFYHKLLVQVHQSKPSQTGVNSCCYPPWLLMRTTKPITHLTYFIQLHLSSQSKYLNKWNSNHSIGLIYLYLAKIAAYLIGFNCNLTSSPFLPVSHCVALSRLQISLHLICNFTLSYITLCT